MSSVSTNCFHCDENIPNNIEIYAQINNQSQAVCCYGCKAVAEFIAEQGYDEFYNFRGEAKPANKAEVGDSKWLKCDEDINFSSLTKKISECEYQISLRIEGLYCSACGWLIDKHLSQTDGVTEVRLNTITRQLQITFKPKFVKLSQILTSINLLGYQFVFTTDSNQSSYELQERKAFLKRIVVSGFGMMQVMTMSVPLYSDAYNIEPNIKRFFELVSLIVATIVFFYSGKVFLKNAWRDLSNKHLGMDVPVAASITLAYLASCWNVFTGSNDTIYFDSLIMFIFFLLAGRYIEMSVRHQGMNSKDALTSMIPTSVQLLKNEELISAPLSQIQKGDVLVIDSGDAIPCDGKIIKGHCLVDESLLTGESVSIKKEIDNTVMAGTIIQEGSIFIKSTAIGEETFLAGLGSLLETAQLQKPKTILQVDNIAVWFVAAVLLIAVAGGIFYSIYQPDLTLPIVLSVLVATCPCALSLATPTSLTAATIALMKKGVLVNNLDSLTNICNIREWFFDKTGTLTQALMSVVKIHNHSSISDQKLLKIMAVLEHQSTHPIASAFNNYYEPNADIKDYHEISGQGVEAFVNKQKYKAGRYEWCFDNSTIFQKESENTLVYLSSNNQILAVFELNNELRKDTREIISDLQKMNTVKIISGDKKAAVTRIAENLNISEFYYEQTPLEKINKIQMLQEQNKATVMVGDGINDAPVLGQSDVSISFNKGAQIARSASDIILMGESLKSLKNLLMISKKTNNIIKQNIIWAILYNLSVTPLALMGYLAPWMAAIGMSISSLIVVVNARRILK